MKVSILKEIPADLETVYAIFTDLENMEQRIEGIDTIEMITDGPIGVGTRFKETRTMMNRSETQEMEITAIEPNHSFTLSSEACGCVYTIVHRFKSIGSATMVELDFEGRPLTFTAKLFTPLSWCMIGFTKKMLDKDLSDLKKYIESNHRE
jgi:carbon monoxide dehydrogenase subunit G